MITVYGLKGRSRAERVLWALRELQLPYKMIRLDYQNGELNTEKFLTLNPSGKVPVIQHNGHVFTESVAIIQYLSAVSEYTIIPINYVDKYVYDNRMMYLLTEIEPYLWISDQASILSNLYKWPPNTEESSQTILSSNLKQIDLWLESSEYIAGSVFTAVDIVAYHLLSWSTSYNVTSSEKVAGYLTRLESRPAFPQTMKNPGSPAKKV